MSAREQTELGNDILENDKAGPTSVELRGQVLDILEQQPAQLDAVGARKAAAHLDAAIEQLRRELECMANQSSHSEPPSQQIGAVSEPKHGKDEDWPSGPSNQMSGTHTAQPHGAVSMPQ